MTRIKAVLFDLSGVLYDGDKPLNNAVQAVNKLSKTKIPIRYVTNTTRSTKQDIVDRLIKMGFNIDESEIFTAPNAVHDYLKTSHLSPYLLVHPNLKSEFLDLPVNNKPAVVVGDAAEEFTYDHMNQAFRILIRGAPLIAMGNNRYFKEKNELSLDMGPFVRALEYASGTKAKIIGKPAKAFFEAAVNSTNCETDEVIMIGDDVQSDIVGALKAGLQGILVKTGKYQEKDELQLDGKGYCMKNIMEAVDFIIQSSSP